MAYSSSQTDGGEMTMALKSTLRKWKCPGITATGVWSSSTRTAQRSRTGRVEKSSGRHGQVDLQPWNRQKVMPVDPRVPTSATTATTAVKAFALKSIPQRV